MDNQRINEQDIIDKYTLHQNNFYKSFAKDYLTLDSIKKGITLC